MSLLFNMLSRLVITFLPRSKHLLISWLQSPSAVILEPKKTGEELSGRLDIFSFFKKFGFQHDNSMCRMTILKKGVRYEQAV